MRIRHCREGVERIVEIGSGLDGYTASDLVAALEPDRLAGAGTDGVEPDPDAALGIVVDGCWHPVGVPLADIALREGSRVEIDPRPSPSALSAAPSGLSEPGGAETGLVLAVVGGLRAGDRLAVPPTDTWVVGRERGCDLLIDDPTLSRRHLRVGSGPAPVLTDLGARNPTTVRGADGVRRALAEPTPVPPGTAVQVGATSLAWRAEADDVPAAVRSGLGAAGGRVPFNRPPRRAPPTEPAPLAAPAEPPPRPDPEPLSWAGILLPVAAGAVLALVWSPIMAVFAALGPVLTVGTWLERRRRATRAHRAAVRAAAGEIKSLEAILPGARAAEHRRRLGLAPDPAELTRRAEGPSVRCWERRRSDPDFMVLGVGAADVAYDPPLETSGGGPPAPTAVEMIAALPPLAGVPVTVRLADGCVVGLVGPPGPVRAVARCLVVQAAVLHGPADVAIAALSPDPDGDWSWLRWLPHTADSVGGGAGALVATDAAAMAGAAEAVAADGAGQASGAVLAAGRAGVAEAAGRLRLVVMDGSAALVGRAAPGRALLGADRVAAIVIAGDVHELPASCTAIVEVVHPAGGLRLIEPRSATVLDSLTAWGMTTATASAAAARLARLDDPELGPTGADLPDSVALVDLMGEELTPESVERRWARTRGTAGLAAPVGVDSDGVLELDLVADGPHLLIGGTTGSGKSELLRSLVAGLALSADPDHLAFVLVDYKGGAAFDCCADLAHVAGLVTDLDDRLAERALRCLEAELRYREERLRQAGAEDLAAYRAQAVAGAGGGEDPACSAETGGGGSDEHPGAHRVGKVGPGGDEDPLPRLVVVVDEFATLAAELPEFVDSLVGIGQRGRSLGVHLVLATQRPAGAVTEDIRANTSCRIALRVTDRHDSNDVIGAADAAAIPRYRPGRALARFGPGELVAFQSALVTGVTPPAARGLRVRVIDEIKVTAPTEPLDPDSARASEPERPAAGPESPVPEGAVVGPEPAESEVPAGPESTDPSEEPDIVRVVRAVNAAHRRRGGAKPRSPWPPPLPEEVDAEELAAAVESGRPAAWLVDDPDRQRRFTDGWQPDCGHLVVVGGPGSGTTTTLVGAGLDLARTRPPDDLHLYGIDLDGGKLSVLSGLPHTGAVVSPADRERRVRLLRHLDSEVAARRARRGSTSGTGPGTGSDPLGGEPEIVFLIDGLAGLARAHDPVRDGEPHRWLERIWGDGPSVGVRVAVSVGRAADLPGDMAASAGVVLVHATGDPGDGSRFGLRADTSGLGPGRAIRASDRRELQVARFAGGDEAAAVRALAAAADAPDPARAPAAIGSLPAVVSAAGLPVSAEESHNRIAVRFALGDLGLAPVGFALHDGEHALVLGPPGSGRTSALAAIGAAAGPLAVVVADEPTDLCRRLGLDPVPVAEVERLVTRRVVRGEPGDRHDCPEGSEPPSPGRRVLLVDDADRATDPDGALGRIAADAATRLHIVAAVRPDRLRSAYGGWLSELRASRSGVLFRPGPVDGDLLGATLPARLDLPAVAGRGVVVSAGAAAVAQIALVEETRLDSGAACVGPEPDSGGAGAEQQSGPPG